MTKRMLDDVKVNVKWKISALWCALMFLYIYADFFASLQPEHLELIDITQWLLLFGAISMTIPSVMIFLSLLLKPRVNRWANIILGIVYTGLNISTLISFEEPWAYFIFYSSVELALSLLIVWYAWKWPKQEA